MKTALNDSHGSNAIIDDKHTFWEKMMKEYEKSDFPAKEFCRINNVSFSQFRNWRFRINKKQKTNAEKMSIEKKFIPLIVKDEPVMNKQILAEHSIELKLEPSGNIHIYIPSQFNQKSLNHLLTIVGKMKC